MKNIPNEITISRILLSISLFFLKPFSSLFLIIYLLCGFSDMIDGYIARKMDTASKFGAILDSIADVVFIISAAITILPAISIPLNILIWILIILLVRIVSLVFAYFKYHAFAMLHTYFNKVTGILLFCLPLLYKFIDIYILGYVVCTVASAAAVEEFLIHINSKELSRNVKGIFEKRI